MPLNDDIDDLKTFNEKAKLLRKSSFLQSLLSKKSGATLKWKKGEGFKSKLRGPKEEAVRAFVLTFRMFIQKNDVCSFHNMEQVYNRFPISERQKNTFRPCAARTLCALAPSAD